MKPYLISLLTALCCFSASAQTVTPRAQRNIRINIIGQDSVKLAFDNEFALIEDSCSQITRFAHLAPQQFFTGKFTDVSSAKPQLLITSGNYDDNGLKDGPFIINYLNGSPRAKGSFKENIFDGKWEMFYEDGKPKLTFEANGTDIKIIDAWDAKGVKTVDNGKGGFRADLEGAYWKGKLVNGKPEGTWKSKITSTNADLNSESYKNGVFQQGSSAYGDYNTSRLLLVAVASLNFVRAEKFFVSSAICGSTGTGNKVYAHYEANTPSSAERVAEVVNRYLTSNSDKILVGTIILGGEIDKTGMIQKLRQTNASFDGVSAHEIIGRLYTLPRFLPATIDNKPVKQNFTVTIKVTRKRYDVSFQLLPLENN